MLLTLFVATDLAYACGGPEPKAAKHEESVPANSFHEPKPQATTESHEHEAPKDPTQPYMTKVGDPPPDGSSKPGKSAPSTTGGAPAASGGNEARVSQGECDQMFDKLIELEIASNPQLKGAGPDVVKMAKDMARQRGGAPPCTATHKEYACAMAATSTAAWKKCVK
jgi:hypothetical protein